MTGASTYDNTPAAYLSESPRYVGRPTTIGVAKAPRSSLRSPSRKRRGLPPRAAGTTIFLRACTFHVDRSCPNDCRDAAALRTRSRLLRPRPPRPSPALRAIHTELRSPVQHSTLYTTMHMNIEELPCLCASYIPILHVLPKTARTLRTDRHAPVPSRARAEKRERDRERQKLPNLGHSTKKGKLRHPKKGNSETTTFAENHPDPTDTHT